MQLWRTVLFTGLTAATVARTIDIGAPLSKERNWQIGRIAANHCERNEGEGGGKDRGPCMAGGETEAGIVLSTNS